MKKVLIFAGTTEGRKLAEILTAAGISCEISVATEYGKQMIAPNGSCKVHTGRKNAADMLEWMRAEKPAAVVDATHPFATEASVNIKESAGQAGVPYLRLRRSTAVSPAAEQDILYATDAAECKTILEQTEGNILLTTGSKDLHIYAVENLKERLFVRILPAEESIMLCKKQGLAGSQIIAMHGPFSKELNKALLMQYQIDVLVTKESGVQGGFPEKIEAARETGTKIVVIKNPENKAASKKEKQKDEIWKDENKDSLGQVLAHLEKLLQISIPFPQEKIYIYLAGAGMGTRETLTRETLETIKAADFIFGAERMLGASYVQKNKKARKLPYYLFSDILPYIKNMHHGEKAVILFSGDSGFYSGAARMQEELMAAAEKERIEIEVKTLPGISSISYMAAKAGISWQDAKIISSHGKNTSLLSAILKEKKLFLLTSGAEDMQKLGALLEEWQLFDRKLVVGYQMSYPEEEILYLTPKQCKKLTKPGLYSCFILKEEREKSWGMTPGFSDDMFFRDRVPMTKEEVREISLCKLRLTKDAVLYDVGSGTGSIAVEAAFLSETIDVYAVEKKQTALDLIQRNCEKYALKNVNIIGGTAPQALEKLPMPTHVFIGGSGGNLFQILQTIYEKNTAAHVVINAISLETAAQLQQLEKEFPICHMEIVQLQVSRSKEIGGYHLMQAENPVFVCSFDFKGAIQ